MRMIVKGVEPVELQEYRAHPGTEYDGDGFTEVKARIREALLADQGHLCAYCMKRISVDSMKVEHWHSQAGCHKKQLDYGNMLGCCMGNQGRPLEEQHCDTRKADSCISLNPANGNDHARMKIRYDGYGKIRSENQAFDRDINKTLNLNLARLMSNRKEAWKAVTDVLSRGPGGRTPGEVRKLIVSWNQRDADGRLKPFCEVAIYYLKKKQARMK